MTTIRNQVTCSLCNMKTDELKWQEQLVSTNPLRLCKKAKIQIAIKFFEMMCNTNPEKSKITNLKIEKKHMVSGSYIFPQNHQKKNLLFYAVIQSIIQN